MTLPKRQASRSARKRYKREVGYLLELGGKASKRRPRKQPSDGSAPSGSLSDSGDDSSDDDMVD